LGQQDLEGRLKYKGVALECPPWLQAWFRFPGYLAKPTLFDETKQFG